MFKLLLIAVVMISACSSAPKAPTPAAKTAAVTFDAVAVSFEYSLAKRQATLGRSARLVFTRTLAPGPGEIALSLRCEVPLKLEIVGDAQKLNQSLTDQLRSFKMEGLTAGDAKAWQTRSVTSSLLA